MKNITKLVELSDIFNGLIKAACFGLILSLVGCYKGFNTTGGAEGVGRATTEAVVLASITILISDYFLTALMF
jgi:phospholipid/cholesterol/gamma-HCH transport system permease protein